MEFPKRLKRIPIKEALSEPSLRQLLLRNVNPQLYLSIQGDLCDEHEDMLIWKKSNSGLVTTKDFISSYAHKAPKVSRFEAIWHPWLPLKISCFVWKIQWRAVPTDDRIRSVGIPIMSKCVCCRISKEESADHLFFNSDMAMQVWDFLSPIFRRTRPKNAQEFLFEWGVRAKFRSFADCLAFGTASCALWEIWKIRCSRTYEKLDSPFNIGMLSRWAGILSKSIGASCVSDLGTVRMCEALNIVVPLAKEFKVIWRSWTPHSSGNTCNIAINISDSSSTMAAIMRDRRGRFLFAMKLSSIKKQPIKCFQHILSELQLAGVSISCIKSASCDICDLGKDVEVDWSNFQTKRKVARLCRGVEVFRVCPALNRPADALCFATIGSFRTDQVDTLPRAVTMALINDSSGLPCSFFDQRIYM